MIALGFVMGFILILQMFILVGICRTNNKLNEVDESISTLNNLIVPSISANMRNITHILDQLTDIANETPSKKKHKKKKDKIYADNMTIETKKKGTKFL